MRYIGYRCQGPAHPDPKKGIYPYRKVNQIKPDQRYVLKARFKLTFTLNPDENGMDIDLVGDTGDAFSNQVCDFDITPVTHPKVLTEGIQNELNER